MKNKKGIITLQFLIVLIIILFFLLSFFGLALTLVNGSVVQYLTYSSARKLSLADESQATQIEQASLYYRQLRQKLFGGNFTSSGDWFLISRTPNIGFNSIYGSTDNSYRKMFYGVSSPFHSTRTNFKIPFLTDQDDGELKTMISSYLGREASKEECENFNRQRMAKICEIYNNIGGTACQSPQDTPSDNGC